MHYSTSIFIAILLLIIPTHLWSAPDVPNQKAVDRLALATNGTAKVSFKKSTGAANFVRLAAGSVRLKGATDEARARDFFQQHGDLFGVVDHAKELITDSTKIDRLGARSVRFHQEFEGVPVFGAELRAHFDASGKVKTVNGTYVPNIKISTKPRLATDAITDTALKLIAAQFPDATGLIARSATLYVYRQGLIQGIKGRDHLVYEIEVTNRSNVREFLYIDAIKGTVVNQLTGTYDAMNRRAFDAEGSPPPYPNYPTTPFWQEGASLPTASVEADNAIYASGDTYDFFFNAFDRDSFDGQGATMDALFDLGDDYCPNAYWNGIYTAYCPGVTADDVVAHEWGHAYTQFTSGLVYQWQPGALSESYSDIWGEVVDMINGRGTDSPSTIRTADTCSIYPHGRPPPLITITEGSAEGTYPATATYNRPWGWEVPSAQMAMANPSSACSLISNGSGKIVIVDYTLLPNGDSECSLNTRLQNVYSAGGLGIIIVAPPSGPVNQTGYWSNSIQVSHADGETIKSGLPAIATIEYPPGTEDSVRWLQAEDSTAYGGAIRDMWNPNCFHDPGKVTDAAYYTCSTDDGGGVHTNSGVPNHAFALLVDGGTYNGQTIASIGIIKAANIFFRAMTQYMVATDGFHEHADAMESSCNDLIGVNLPDFTDGQPSGQVINSDDCAQLAKATLATELRTAPTFCNFEPLFEPINSVAVCAGPILEETFEANPFPEWTLSNVGVFDAYSPRDWEWSGTVPIGGSGKAMFGVDGDGIGDCAEDDQSGAMRLDSPLFTIPSDAANPVVTFDHYVATEVGYDGGNVKISVNGGIFQLIDPADFILNAYNGVLYGAPDNTNPLAGEHAFTGTNGGLPSGSWGQSRIMLGNYTAPGDEVKIRFEFGVDGCGGLDGWYVDNVNVCKALDFVIFANGFE